MTRMILLEKKQLLGNALKLCMSAYEQCYDGVPFHEESAKQYQVDDNNLNHLLLF